MRLTEIHPILYNLRISQKRFFRSILNMKERSRFSKNISRDSYPFTCKKHQSLLRRKLGNSDPQLQENKITNLKLAASKLDGILINPGETFSFWELVGKASRKKGYIEGMLLSMGRLRPVLVGGFVNWPIYFIGWLFIHL